MFFLTETTDQVEILTEETASGKRLFIEGIFSSADKPNRNKRVYSKSVMETAVAEYKKDYIDTKKAIGEINHPNTPMPDMRKAAILIESLEWKNEDVIGKASVMSTPEGQILKGLIESGYKVGISSRGTGSVRMNKGINEVQKDFRMFAYDVVSNPSNYGSEMDSMIEGIMEGHIWVPKSEEIIQDVLEATGMNLSDVKAKSFIKILEGLK
jgi:hypothetical protein